MTNYDAKNILRRTIFLLVSIIILRSPVNGQAVSATQTRGLDPAAAKSTFERLKKLQGTWVAKSTKGWEEQTTFNTIAAGSAVVEEGVNAHPGETMLTVFHLDGDRLMLTHYCVAKNQPRLVASSISDDGRTVTFTFLDATNLSSRNQGHMDKAVYQFIDDDHFATQWTWYSNASEQWMEKIESKRVAAGRPSR